MLRLCVRKLSKRTPGYVFWRERTLMDLETSKRNYLMSEKPTPLAEVVRRMVQVKARYQDTQDYHERTLLRGEYKYFSGKPCDLRTAETTDMISFLECGSFFGFWDVSQIDLVLEELKQRYMFPDHIDVEELVHLMVVLPSLRKDGSTVYQQVANLLLSRVSELSAEECARICVASTPQTPDNLLLALIHGLEPEVSSLSPSVMVELLDTLCSITDPDKVEERRLEPLRTVLESHIVTSLDKLDPIEVAVAYASLVASRKGEDESVHMSFLQSFVSQSEQVCARSMAIFCSAMGVSLSGIYDNTRESFSNLSDSYRPPLLRAFYATERLGPRVIFLSVEFSPSEMIPILRLWLYCCVVAHQPRFRETDVKASDFSFITRSRSALLHVLRELTDQLVIELEEGSGYVPPYQLVEFLQMYDGVLKGLGREQEQNGIDVETQTKKPKTSSIVSSPRRKLAEWIPSSPRVWKMLSKKVVSSKMLFSLEELLLLIQVDPSLLEDAALTSLLHELTKSRYQEGVFSSSDESNYAGERGPKNSTYPSQKRVTIEGKSVVQILNEVFLTRGWMNSKNNPYKELQTELLKRWGNTTNLHDPHECA